MENVISCTFYFSAFFVLTGYFFNVLLCAWHINCAFRFQWKAYKMQVFFVKNALELYMKTSTDSSLHLAPVHKRNEENWYVYILQLHALIMYSSKPSHVTTCTDITTCTIFFYEDYIVMNTKIWGTIVCLSWFMSAEWANDWAHICSASLQWK